MDCEVNPSQSGISRFNRGAVFINPVALFLSSSAECHANGGVSGSYLPRGGKDVISRGVRSCDECRGDSGLLCDLEIKREYSSALALHGYFPP